jgi:hypothetical protein
MNNYDGAAQDFIAAHRLKWKILISFLVISVCYICLILTGLAWQEKVKSMKLGKELTLSRIYISKEIIEYLLVGTLFIILRPRSWP